MTAVKRVKALESTGEFWNASPCGGQESLAKRIKHRYSMEPWIPYVLKKVASEFSGKSILEVGSGQGTDGIVICKSLSSDSKYVGIDYSKDSVASAIAATKEAGELNVKPIFQEGNAENLSFKDASIDCVYTLGVIHHTPDTDKALSEIYRVLKPGGRAFIAVYRVWSPKLIVAKTLRGVQLVFDKIFRKDRIFYNFLYGRHGDSVFGTMFLECFGVPYLKCYTHAKFTKMLENAGFKVDSMKALGYNTPHIGSRGKSSEFSTPFGYFIYTEVRKSI